MAGYSQTPLAKKLGIKADSQLLVHAAPDGFANLLEPLPAYVRIHDSLRSRGPFDVIVGFVLTRRRLDIDFPKLKDRLGANGGLWIAWPKKASGVATDVTEAIVRETGLTGALVDNKICAIDEVWSGLRFVYRLKDRR